MRILWFHPYPYVQHKLGRDHYHHKCRRQCIAMTNDNSHLKKINVSLIQRYLSAARINISRQIFLYRGLSVYSIINADTKKCGLIVHDRAIKLNKIFNIIYM